MKIKYTLVGLLASFFCLPIFCQYTLIDKARMAKERGMYAAALEILDDAEDKARPGEMGKLWYERASVLERQYWKEDKSMEQLSKLLDCYKFALQNSYDQLEKINYTEKIDQWWKLLIQEGKNSYVNGAYPTALAYFDFCKDLSPQKVESYYFSGLCYFDQEDWENAQKMMQHSLDGQYHQTEAYRVMIHIARFVEHDTRKAVVYADKGLTHMPNDLYLREEMAMMLIHLGEFVLARPHLLWLINNNPENSEYLFNLARSYEESQELYTAEWFYENLLENEPQNFEAWYNLGVLNYNQASGELSQSETQKGFGHLTKAMYAFEEASRLQPKNPEVLQNLYHIYKCMGLVEKAKYVRTNFPQARLTEQMGAIKN